MRKILVSMYKKGYKILSGSGIGRFYLVRVINDFIVYHLNLRSNFIEVQGHQMFLDKEDSLLLSGVHEPIHEPFETELVKKEIKRGDIVLDIGAHIGYFTLIFAKLVGEEGKVFAFEPDPSNFALLKKNVEINGYRNVLLVQKAVTNKAGKIKLYLCKYNSGMHRIYESQFCSQSIEIEAIRLDDYFKDYHGKIDFIKMDVEGSEFSAIQGMSLLLQTNNQLKILTEFAPVSLKESGIEPEGYLRLLIANGFQLYNVNEEKKKIEPSIISELLEEYTPENKEFLNLLCIREK